MKFRNPFKRKPKDDAGMRECYEARRKATVNKLTNSDNVIRKMEAIWKQYERRESIIPIDFPERRRA